MSSSLFREYRCTCGKLLFKGLLCQCVVEVKCRRCGALRTWGLDETFPYTVVESDAEARMVGASGDLGQLLGYEWKNLIGRPITDVFPLLRDAASYVTEGSYQLQEMPFLLKDGRQELVDACVMPRYADGAFAGYRVFSVPKQTSSV